MPYPSIVVWVPFNEAWGQFKTKEIAEWTEAEFKIEFSLLFIKSMGCLIYFTVTSDSFNQPELVKVPLAEISSPLTLLPLPLVVSTKATAQV